MVQHAVTVTRMALMLTISCACLPAAGETAATPRYNGAGYLTFGVGACQHRVTNTSVSGGGYGLLWKGLALGGDIGYYRFVERNSNGFGIGTIDVGYHFVNRARPGRLDPFVSMGIVGVGFVSGGAGAAGSLGGGVNYWFKPRLGLRTEFRVHGFCEEAIAMFHIGLSFR
jgi:hypothetical protein